MDWSTFWNAVGAVGSAAAAILAIAALLYSLRTFRESTWLSNYENLDTMYLELLRTALDKPHLRESTGTRTPEQQQEYEIYAHMVWCVMESIFDRARHDKELLDVWHSAIDIENRLHREWFDRPQNEYKFRKTFRNYIQTHFPSSANKSQLRSSTVAQQIVGRERRERVSQVDSTGDA